MSIPIKRSRVVRSATVWLFSSVTVAMAAQMDALEFVGVMEFNEGSSRLFMIRHVPTQTGSGWIRLEASFQMHKLVEYRKDDETLVLEKDGEKLRLRLQNATIDKSGKYIKGALTLLPAKGTSPKQIELMYGRESQYELGDGRILKFFPTEGDRGWCVNRVTLLRRAESGEIQQILTVKIIDKPTAFVNLIAESGEVLFTFRPEAKPTP